MEKANPIYVSDYILFIQSTKFSNGENGNVIQQPSNNEEVQEKFDSFVRRTKATYVGLYQFPNKVSGNK